jgi:integrase/recombinase XerC/integrase/recombinase XerD
MKKAMTITLVNLIDMFTAAKEVENKSKATVKWYRHMLLKYVAFIGGDARLSDLNLANARQFIASLQARDVRYSGHPLLPEQKGGLSAHSIHGYVRTLRVFSAWLMDEGFTPTDVLIKLKRPKLPETLIEVLTDTEVGVLLKALNPGTHMGSRLQAIIYLLYDTGIRAAELCTLTMDNLDLVEGVLKVKGKGNKERIVPFGAVTKKALMRYTQLYRVEGKSNLVFTTNEGDGVTYTALAHMLARLGKRCDIPRLHAHLFRHSFACRYLLNGGDLVSLRKILGHTDVKTTEMYLKLTDANVVSRYHAFSPVDRLGK